MQWVLVHWVDIVSCEHPWMDEADARELRPAEMWSTGIIIHQDQSCVVLAGTYMAADNTCGNVNAIPKGVIKSIRQLSPVEPRSIGGDD